MQSVYKNIVVQPSFFSRKYQTVYIYLDYID